MREGGYRQMEAKQLDVVTIGEGLIVLRPPHYGTLEQTRVLECLVAGAEANVAVGLSRLGLRTGWVGKVPDSPLGRTVVHRLRGHDVDVSGVVWSPERRQGLMIIEQGLGCRPNQVLYDRQNSAGSSLAPEEVERDYIGSAGHLHMTGITPALSESCLATTRRALQVARDAGLSTSFDLNFRSRLWPAQGAGPILAELVDEADVIFAGRNEVEELFGLTEEPAQAARILQDRHKAAAVVLTLGADGAVACADTCYQASAHHVPMRNRFGLGDSYAAGFLYIYLTEADIGKALAYGAACAALSMGTPNENMPLFTRQQVEQLVTEGYAANPDNWPDSPPSTIRR